MTLVTKEMTFPNGIALSPDEKTLYVANSDPRKAIWMAFPLKDDGTVGPGRVFADVTTAASTKKGLPDGMKVDKSGNLFATGPGACSCSRLTAAIWAPSAPARQQPTADGVKTVQSSTSRPICTWAGFV